MRERPDYWQFWQCGYCGCYNPEEFFRCPGCQGTWVDRMMENEFYYRDDSRYECVYGDYFYAGGEDIYFYRK